MNNTIMLAAYFLCTYYCMFAIEQKGIVCVPVADLVGQPMQTQKNIGDRYQAIPACGANNLLYNCPRLHQILYNDVVNIIRFTENEVCVSVNNAYYCKENDQTLYNTYWTLRKNIVLLSDCVNNHIHKDHIPPTIEFSDKNHTGLYNPEVITLIEPHYDAILQQDFSVGTRFIKTAESKKRLYQVFAFDYPNMKEIVIQIPQHKCIIITENQPQDERIKVFIKLLRKWIHNKRGCIPYVWGGTSYSYAVKGTFKELVKTTPQGDLMYYHYDKDIHTTKNGFDCSGLILRAAQICGIPYFYKNTTTLSQQMIPLQSNETLANGDLIFIKGHVMIVSDIDKNLLIEARGYNHGYGKLHEISLNSVFEKIETYKDLIDAFFEKKIIKRKDKTGVVRDSFSNLRLFPLKKVWDKYEK